MLACIRETGSCTLNADDAYTTVQRLPAEMAAHNRPLTTPREPFVTKSALSALSPAEVAQYIKFTHRETL